jgi:hypothetical protein
MYNWIDINEHQPDFCVYGFHTGRKIWYKLDTGEEILGIYQGYCIFGSGEGHLNVTHWKPQDGDPLQL